MRSLLTHLTDTLFRRSSPPSRQKPQTARHVLPDAVAVVRRLIGDKPCIDDLR
jgi:hypothetical protein